MIPNSIPFVLFLTFALNFLIGLFVYFKNKQKVINQVFATFAIAVAGWNFTIWALLIFGGELWISRIAFSMGALMTSAFFLFALAFPEKENIGKFSAYLLVPITILLFASPLINDLFVRSVVVKNGSITGTFGPLYWIYVPFPPLFILGASAVLIRKYFYLTGRYRLQLRYIFLGGVLFLVPMIMTNLLLPAVFNVFDYNALGPTFTIFMIIATSYAILRYHLMDIWVVIRLGTIYAVLFSAITLAYTLITTALGNYVEGRMRIILPSLILTFGFIPLKNAIETATDRVFFRKKFRYERLIQKFNQVIHSFGLNLAQLLESFNLLITNDLRASSAAVFLTIPKGNFISRQIVTDKYVDIELAPDNPLVSYLHRNPGGVLEREILKLRPDPALADVVSELDRLNFSLVLPIVSKNELIGIYGIGPKKSQDPYGSEEVELLRFLASESAHVIDNARYFEDLKKIDAAKSKFISVTSHELRTPLTSILWNLEFLMSRKIKNKVVNEMLGYVYYSASFINEHLDDMLTALDIEEHKDNIFLKKEVFPFVELIKESLDSLNGDAEKKKNVIDISLAKGITEINADRTKLKKVLLALLRNAVSYNPIGGHVTIRGEVRGVNGESFLECAVKDEGMGISEEEKGSIFSKFYRSDAARLASPNGFGISLFIAKNFIEAHGGEMWFSSAGRDKGATFYFKIPLKKE